MAELIFYLHFSLLLDKEKSNVNTTKFDSVSNQVELLLLLTPSIQWN